MRAGACLGVVALLAGCPRPEPSPDDVGEPEPGGTAIVGVRADFSGLNAITNTALYTDELIKYGLFVPLVRYDEDLEVAPALAASWELEGDTAVVFHLRDDVFWHDGEPVTAADVHFTFERATDPATGSLIGSAYLGHVHSAAVIDDRTIRFGFAPHAQALESFWWAPMPQHLLGDIAPAELRNAAFNRQPVGSGPFRFVEWRANERLVIERNPDFSDGLGGPPFLERIVFRVIPEPATMLTEQLVGRVDVNLQPEPDQVPEIERSRQLELVAYPGRTFSYIGWNNARAPFDRAEIRRALTLGIDRSAIVDALLLGQGAVAMGPIPPWHPYHPAALQPLPYDPEQAERLLDETGWTRPAPGAIRQDAAGRPLRFELMTSDAPLSRAVVEVVQDQLRRIGVDARLRILEFGTLIAHHRRREFDAVYSNWVLDNFQMASTPMALFHSRWVDVPESTNRSSVAHPRADALIERGAAATDRAEARQVWREFTELLQQEQFYTFMFWRNDLTAIGPRIGGVAMDPRGQLLSMQAWWIARR